MKLENSAPLNVFFCLADRRKIYNPQALMGCHQLAQGKESTANVALGIDDKRNKPRAY